MATHDLFLATAPVRSRRRAAVLAAYLAAALLLAVFVPGKALAAWSYGGEIDTSFYNPNAEEYTVSSAAQLAGLSYLCTQKDVTFEGKTILLASDIDISGNEWEPIGNPYGTTGVFMGTFDGQGHTVSGLTINNKENNQALFGHISDATIRDLTVRGSVIASEKVSGIVAWADRSQLYNLVNYANVSSVGAIPYYDEEKSYNGQAAGVVCYSTALSPSGESVYEGLINYGNIRGTGPSGNAGVIGFLAASRGYTFRILGCENYGNVYISVAQNVESLSDGCGGVVGSTSNDGTYIISRCKNAGGITTSNLGSVGGVVGSIHGQNSVIEKSSNTGSITNLGTDFDAPTNDTPTAGGIVSQFESVGGSVSNNYSSGSISASSGHSAGIIGATTQDIGEIAENNYYLDGSSTGAFNDSSTGVAGDRVMAGTSADQDTLDNLIDQEAGGVKDMDMSNYKWVALDDPTEKSPAESPQVDTPPFTLVLCFAAAFAVLAGGAVAEYMRFSRGRSMKGASVG